MDFEEILKRWERSGDKDMERLLSRYPPKGPKEEERSPQSGRAAGRKQVRSQEMRNLPPQASLDLHGLNSREAEQALGEFIARCRRVGLHKVLIIHGKGHHSGGEPVLRAVVQRYLERCPHTGAFGSASGRHGGRGATWVVLR